MAKTYIRMELNCKRLFAPNIFSLYFIIITYHKCSFIKTKFIIETGNKNNIWPFFCTHNVKQDTVHSMVEVEDSDTPGFFIFNGGESVDCLSWVLLTKQKTINTCCKIKF